MLDVILDTLLDCVKLLPFLFLTYLAMEYIEHKAGERIQETIKKSGKCGPLIGSILGAFPQCGFSAAASNLYAARIITLGTLISIYLSTSDEMLPILISQQVGAAIIWKILGIKVLIGMASGFLIDIVLNMFLKKEKEALQIEQLCEHHHCQCEKGIIKSAFRHTIEIFIYLLLITFLLNIFIAFIGEDFLANFLLDRPVIGEVIAGLVGLIPNCAASVVITQLYLNGILSEGAMMAGLLVGAGVGILVLLRVNDKPRDNVRIIALLYALGVAAGIIVELLGITF